MKNILILIIVIFCAISVQAQEEYFSFKGRIVSEDSLKPIPNVNIISELSHYGTTTNQEGFFTIKSKSIDTLWVSCIGFEKQRAPVFQDSLIDKILIIKLLRKTEVLDEVEIYPYPDYETFKRMIIEMPSRKPYFVPGVSKEGDEKLIHKKPERTPKASVASPISLIYNRFNGKEVFKRKLIRNRKRYNKQLMKQGAPDSLLIPETPDFY